MINISLVDRVVTINLEVGVITVLHAMSTHYERKKTGNIEG